MKVFVSHFYVDFDVSLTAIGMTLEAAQYASEQTAKTYMSETITWSQEDGRTVGSLSCGDACYIIEEQIVTTQEY